MVGTLISVALLLLVPMQDPGEGTLIALIEASNSSDPAALERFARSRTDPEVAKLVPLEDRVRILRSLKDSLGRIELVGIDVAGPGRLIGIVRTAKKGAMRLEVVVGGSPTYGVQSIRALPPSDVDSRAPYFEGFRSLEELAKAALKEGKAPAIAIARGAVDGAPEVWVAGKRHVDRPDLAQRADLWLVGSIGKSMTATMIARLVDRGKLRWGTTLGEAFAGVPMNAPYRKVTLLQLLQHRGGIPQDLGVRAGGPITPADILRFAHGAKSPAELRQNYAKNILSRDPGGPPGVFRYSNAGYALACVMAERATGRSFEELMRVQLFEPLGMRTARIASPGTRGTPGSEGQPHGHQIDGDGKVSPHILAFASMNRMFAPAGGGVAMSIGDLARYGQFHLSGLRGKARLITQANFDRLHKPSAGPGESYACGWSVGKTAGGEAFSSHNGSDGTFQADLAIFPRRNLIVACVQNMGEESGNPIPEKVTASLAKRAKPTP